MKKVNFNSLENFEVPKEWIEKALNAKPKKKILFRPYVLGTAASLVLVTVLSLLFFKPFKQISEPPVAVSTTAATQATVATIAATENPAETKDPDATEAEPSTEESVEAQIDPTDPDKIEPEPEPETTEPTDDPSKVRLENNWRVHAIGQETYPMNAPVHNSTAIIPESSPLIPKDVLFTGYITIIISPDSPYYDEDVFYLDIKGYYSSDSIEVGGTVVLEPIERENGEKAVSFNLFNEGAYIPSADYSFIFYTEYDNGSYLKSKTLTESLYSYNSVTITI